MSDTPTPERTGDDQLTRALQLLAGETGSYHELETIKMHTTLALCYYARDIARGITELTAAVSKLAPPPVPMVPAADVAQMTADILQELQEARGRI